MIKARCILVFLCFAGSVAFAQMDHMHMHGMMAPPSEATMSSTNNGVTATLQMVPSFADCVAGAQCWHGSSVYPLIASQVFSSNGFVFAIDASHTGYELANNAWVKHAEWGTVYGLQSDGSGNIWGITSQQDSYCAGIGGGHAVSQWNGSSWTLATYCFNQFWVSQAGNVLLIDPNGTVWWNVGSGWVHAPSPNNKPAISAGWMLDGQTFIEVTNDNQIWQYDGANWGQPTNANCCALSISTDPSQTIYVTGTDGNLYHYNPGVGWDKLAYSGGTIGTWYGGFTDGGSMQVWAIGPNANGNNLYRFSDQAIQFQRGAHGQINCTPIAPFNESVCNSFIHTATYYAGWGALHGGPGTTSKVGYMNFNGPGSWNVNAIANLDNVFDAIENPGNYSMNVDGDTECSGDGLLYGDPSPGTKASIISHDFGRYDPDGIYSIQSANKVIQGPLTYPGCPMCSPPYSYWVANGTCFTSESCAEGTYPSHPSSQTSLMQGLGEDQGTAERNVGRNCSYAGPTITLGFMYESIVIPFFNQLGVTVASYRQPLPGYCD